MVKLVQESLAILKVRYALQRLQGNIISYKW